MITGPVSWMGNSCYFIIHLRLSYVGGVSTSLAIHLLQVALQMMDSLEQLSLYPSRQQSFLPQVLIDGGSRFPRDDDISTCPIPLSVDLSPLLVWWLLMLFLVWSGPFSHLGIKSSKVFTYYSGPVVSILQSRGFSYLPSGIPHMLSDSRYLLVIFPTWDLYWGGRWL